MKKRLILLFIFSLGFFLLLSLGVVSENKNELPKKSFNLPIKNEAKLEDNSNSTFKPILTSNSITFDVNVHNYCVNKTIFNALYERLGEYIACEFQAFNLIGKSG